MQISLCTSCGKVLSLSLISPPNFQVNGWHHFLFFYYFIIQKRTSKTPQKPGKNTYPFSHFLQHKTDNTIFSASNTKTKKHKKNLYFLHQPETKNTATSSTSKTPKTEPKHWKLPPFYSLPSSLNKT